MIRKENHPGAGGAGAGERLVSVAGRCNVQHRRTEVNVLTEPIPTYVCEVTATRETRSVKFFCLHCRRAHWHGWPYGDDDIGHRAAHCFTEAGMAAHPRGYELVARAADGARA